MKKLLVLACATTVISLTSGAALADSIKGKIGATGKIGFLIPAESEIGPFKVNPDVGITFGAGIIYGIDDHFAAELDITRSMYGSRDGDFGVTNLALGAQYRFTLSQPRLVPYVGAGVDLLVNDADHGRDVDTTVGVHISGGIDYFIMQQLALTTEARMVLSPDADIKDSHGKLGNFDPSGFTTTFGIRYFFN